MDRKRNPQTAQTHLRTTNMTPQKRHPTEVHVQKETNSMRNFTPHDPSQAVQDAMDEALQHMRCHGDSLSRIFEIFGEDGGFDAVCELHGALSTPFPDPETVQDALREMERSLLRQTSFDVATAAREYNFHADAAYRWHLARVSDLLARVSESVHRSKPR
jgi:hypothetical protein